jgi:hypothetical protein
LFNVRLNIFVRTAALTASYSQRSTCSYSLAWPHWWRFACHAVVESEFSLASAAIELLQAGDLRTGLLEFFKSAGRLICGGVNAPGCLIACLLSEGCCESELIRVKLCEIIASGDAAFTGLFEKHKDKLCEGVTPPVAAHTPALNIHLSPMFVAGQISHPAMGMIKPA